MDPDIIAQFPIGSLIRNRPEVVYGNPDHGCDLLMSDGPHVVVDLIDSGWCTSIVTEPRDYVRIHRAGNVGIERIDIT